MPVSLACPQGRQHISSAYFTSVARIRAFRVSDAEYCRSPLQPAPVAKLMQLKVLTCQQIHGSRGHKSVRHYRNARICKRLIAAPPARSRSRCAYCSPVRRHTLCARRRSKAQCQYCCRRSPPPHLSPPVSWHRLCCPCLPQYKH